jgi:hypothetical protein
MYDLHNERSKLSWPSKLNLPDSEEQQSFNPIDSKTLTPNASNQIGRGEEISLDATERGSLAVALHRLLLLDLGHDCCDRLQW